MEKFPHDNQKIRIRYALRDAQWVRIQDMLPGSAYWMGARAKGKLGMNEAEFSCKIGQHGKECQGDVVKPNTIQDSHRVSAFKSGSLLECFAPNSGVRRWQWPEYQ
jgi:hypothetical protein